MSLSVTMTKLMEQQEAIDEKLQEIELELEKAMDSEVTAKVEWEEAHAEAVIKHRNERKDISQAMAHMTCLTEYKMRIFTEARRKFWEGQQRATVEKQRSITAEAYAYNSELKAGL